MKIQTLSVVCPSCGQPNKESPAWIGTICRQCGSYFTPEDVVPRKQERPVSQPEAVSVSLREIQCHRCGNHLRVSPLSLNCSCSSCGSSISLQKVVIEGQVSKWIDTRGSLLVLQGASLFAPLAICQEAVIIGKVAGVLLVEEQCRFEGKGVQPVQLRAASLRIERGAEFRFPFPVQAASVLVRGVFHGDIYCSGRLTIARRGQVHGRIFAKSIHMEPGGDLQGPLRIGPVDPPAIHLPGHLDALPELRPLLRPPSRLSIRQSRRIP